MACTFIFEQDLPSGINYTSARSEQFDLPLLRECTEPVTSECESLWNNNLCSVEEEYFQPVVHSDVPFYNDEYLYFQFHFPDSYNDWINNNILGGWFFGEPSAIDPDWVISVELYNGCCEPACVDLPTVCVEDLSVTFSVDTLSVGAKVLIGVWNTVNSFVDVASFTEVLPSCYTYGITDNTTYNTLPHPVYTGGLISFYLQELRDYYIPQFAPGATISCLNNTITVTYTQAYKEANALTCNAHCIGAWYDESAMRPSASFSLIHNVECCDDDCFGNEAWQNGFDTVSIKFEEVLIPDTSTLMPQTWYVDLRCFEPNIIFSYVVDTNLSLYDNAVLFHTVINAGLVAPHTVGVLVDGTITIEIDNDSACCGEMIKYWIETTVPCQHIIHNFAIFGFAPGNGDLTVTSFVFTICGYTIDMSAYVGLFTNVSTQQFLSDAMAAELLSLFPTAIITSTVNSASTYLLSVDIPYELTECYLHCDDDIDNIGYSITGTFDAYFPAPITAIDQTDQFDFPCCAVEEYIWRGESPVRCCVGDLNCWDNFVAPGAAKGWVGMYNDKFYQVCKIPTVGLPSVFQFKFTFRQSMNSYVEYITEPYMICPCADTVKLRGMYGSGNVDCDGNVYGFPSQFINNENGGYVGDNIAYQNDYRFTGEISIKSVKFERENNRYMTLLADINSVYLLRSAPLPPYVIDKIIPTMSGMFCFFHNEDIDNIRPQVFWGNSIERNIEPGRMWRLEMECESVKCEVDHKCSNNEGIS